MAPTQPRSPFDLVSFARPPVTEVALTAQFQEPIVDLQAMGAFEQRIREDFPTQSQQQPADPIEPESFDRLPTANPFRLQLQTEAQLPRIWFESSNRERLIQLQADRLSVNWRLLDGDPARYPRYSEIRKTFHSQLLCLGEILEHRVQRLVASACEVLYVNPITPTGKADPHSHPDLASVLNRLKGPPRGAFLGRPEDSQYQARWRIPGQDRPAGRLYLSAVPALSDSQDPIYLVQMISRTAPMTDGLDGIMAALDLGHEWVVKGFADVTTKRMHEIWGEED